VEAAADVAGAQADRSGRLAAPPVRLHAAGAARRARFSLKGFAKRPGKSVSYLSAVELAQARCTRAFMHDCERLLAASGWLAGLWEQANEDWDRRHRRQHHVRERLQAAMAAADTQAALWAAGDGHSDQAQARSARPALVVVSREELAALIEQSTLRALAACLAALGKGKARPNLPALDLPSTEGWPLVELGGVRRLGPVDRLG
jgi:hypothetical protein